MKAIIECSTDENDIVLDAFFGSGTTGAVSLKLGRRFIGIEQLNSHYELAIERLTNVLNGEQSGISGDVKWAGGGSFISLELKQLSSVYISRIKNSNDAELVEIYNELKGSPFVSYRVDFNELENNEDKFEELSIDIKKKVLISVIDKNMLYVNYADMDDEAYQVTELEKSLSDSFYTK